MPGLLTGDAATHQREALQSGTENAGAANAAKMVEFRPLFGGGAPSPFGLVLEDSHLQIRTSFVSPLLQFRTPFKGFLVVQSEIGNAVLPAPIGHLADNRRQIE